MILSRIFSFSLGIFLLVSAITYIFVDTRPIREQAFEALKKSKYRKVLEIYSSEKNLEEEDYAILALSTVGLEEEINRIEDANKQERIVNKIQSEYDIQAKAYFHLDKKCYHLEDHNFSFLKKHAFWYQKVVLEKAQSSYFCNPPEKNSELLNRVLVEDPQNFIEETGNALFHLFQSPLEPIGEIEKKFLLETIHFLADQEKSIFYQQLHSVNGNSVNFRSGPGMENPVVGRLNQDDLLLCMEEDKNREIIAGKSGNWKHCFSPLLIQSGWIFSGQTVHIKPDTSIIKQGRIRFSSLEYFSRVDFENWNEKFSPLNFHGNYIPTKREVRRGEVGFTVYRPEDGKVELLCRKFSGKKNYFEMYYEVIDSEMPIPIAELQIIKGSISYPIFRLSVSDEAILMNGERFVIDHPDSRETLALKINSEKSGFITGTLIHKNKGVIQNRESIPIDEEILNQSGGFSWEICISQAVQKSDDSALLYGFRIGRE